MVIYFPSNYRFSTGPAGTEMVLHKGATNTISHGNILSYFKLWIEM